MIGHPHPAGGRAALRGDIQGMRGLAVLLVIGAHAGMPGLGGGVVGVDVFFVISGFLITSLLLREASAAGRIRMGAFYARRARRILPAATVVVAVTLLFAARELSPSRLAEIRSDGTWSTAFLANVHFSRLGIDYFEQGRSPSPFLHYWSLAIEEQFYLVWPALLAGYLLLRRIRGRSGVGRGLGPVVGALVGASLAYSVMVTAVRPEVAYFSLPARAWELGVGVLLAVYAGHCRRLATRASHWLGVLGLVAIVGSSVLLTEASALPGWLALAPVLGAAAVIGAGTSGETTGVARVLGVPPLRWVGDLSYSLYLWHWPVLVLGADAVGGTGNALVVTLGAAVVSYYLVEAPIRGSRPLAVGNRALILWPMAVASVVVCSSLTASHAAGRLADRIQTVQATAEASNGGSVSSRPTALEPQTQRPRQRERTGRADVGSARSVLAEAIVESDRSAPVPFPLTNLPGLEQDLWQEWFRCPADANATSTRLCPLGDVQAERVLVVYGDSHAGQWLPAVTEYGEDHGYRVIPLVKYGCPPYDIPMVDGSGGEYHSCTAFRRWAQRTIATLNPEVVVLGSQGLPTRMYQASGRDRPQTWQHGVATTLDQLGASTDRLLVLADVPQLPFQPEDCLTDPDATLGSCLGEVTPDLQAANTTLRVAATARQAGYVDVLQLVCLDGACPLVVDRTVTYGDYAHLSISWAHRVADVFSSLLRTASQQSTPHQADAPPGA